MQFTTLSVRTLSASLSFTASIYCTPSKHTYTFSLSLSLPHSPFLSRCMCFGLNEFICIYGSLLLQTSRNSRRIHFSLASIHLFSFFYIYVVLCFVIAFVIRFTYHFHSAPCWHSWQSFFFFSILSYVFSVSLSQCGSTYSVQLWCLFR